MDGVLVDTWHSKARLASFMTTHKTLQLLIVVLLLVCASLTVVAQSQDGDSELLKGFVVEGGRTNRIEGDVQRLTFSAIRSTLKPNEQLENGDTIQTSTAGRAEILLVPGYYLRLDHDTRISIIDLSPENLKLKLWSGAAIVEIAVSGMVTWRDFVEHRKQLSYPPVSLLTRSAEYLVTGGGSYRFQINSNGSSELRVLKGLGFVNGSRVDNGTIASVDGGKLTLTSSKSLDDFDNWSRERAKGLVKANGSLSKSQWYKRVRSNRGYLLITDPEDAARAKDRLTVSAETGVVGLVGNTFVSRPAVPDWQRLKPGERLVSGDRIRTAVESRAEIFVYANCFLFLEGDSEIVYREVEGLASVEMIKGTAIAILAPDPEAAEPPVLTIVAGGKEFRISERGNYRIGTSAGAQSEMMVYEGSKRVPIAQRGPVKKIRATDLMASETMLNKLTGDSFDIWSYRRSRLPEIRRFGRYFGPLGGMWYLVESTGEYTFVPERWEYSSPYGGNYSIRFGDDGSFERRRRYPREIVDVPLRTNRPDKIP